MMFATQHAFGWQLCGQDPLSWLAGAFWPSLPSGWSFVPKHLAKPHKSYSPLWDLSCYFIPPAQKTFFFFYNPKSLPDFNLSGDFFFVAINEGNLFELPDSLLSLSRIRGLWLILLIRSGAPSYSKDTCTIAAAVALSVIFLLIPPALFML